MAYSATVVRILIASPGDVPDERRMVTEEIHRWNDAHAESRHIILQPVKWETNSTPRLGRPVQTELNAQIAETADIVVGIFGTRIGTRTERHVSGTVEEILNHVAANRLSKVYFSDAPVPPSSVDPAQYKALKDFKEECKALGLYATYDDLSSFRRDFKQHIDIELNSPRFQLISRRQSNPVVAAPEVSADAMTLLTKAVAARSPISVSNRIGIDSVHVGGEEMTARSERSLARWRGAIGQLRDSGFVEERTAGSGLIQVTGAGYQAAAKTESSKPAQVEIRIAGTTDKQELMIHSDKALRLLKIEYMQSHEACITDQAVELSGTEIHAQLDHTKLVELNNSSRPDKNPYDHSGPVKLRITLESAGKSHRVILPALLEPKILNNTQWITLKGSTDVTLYALSTETSRTL